jgi:hypothetical protein
MKKAEKTTRSVTIKSYGWTFNDSSLIKRSSQQQSTSFFSLNYLVLRILLMSRISIFIVLNQLVRIEALDLCLNYLRYESPLVHKINEKQTLNSTFTSLETKHSSGKVSKMLTQNRTRAKFMSS